MTTERSYPMNEAFRKIAHKTSEAMGTPWAFSVALGVVIIWAVTGPLFGFSDTWQLVINTGTTIVTFLMVFLIQNTQNRDAKAMHLKLDELIRSIKGARTGLVDLEELSDEDLERLQQEFQRLREHYGNAVQRHVAAIEGELRERKPSAARKAKRAPRSR
jgi:low affinity Fe/Cu permease